MRSQLNSILYWVHLNLLICYKISGYSSTVTERPQKKKTKSVLGIQPSNILTIRKQVTYKNCMQQEVQVGTPLHFDPMVHNEVC